MTLASKFPLKKEEPVVCNTKSEKEMKENKENEGEKVNESDSNKVDEKGRTKGCGLRGEERDDVEVVVDEKKSNGKKNKNQEEKEKLMERKREYWDTLRKIFTKNFRSEEDMDSVDWEGVRVAKASKVAETISARGQHNIIGGRIQVQNYFLIYYYYLFNFVFLLINISYIKHNIPLYYLTGNMRLKIPLQLGMRIFHCI